MNTGRQGCLHYEAQRMAGKIEPTLEVRTITPEMAKELLAMNTKNFRALDQKRVRRYARDILDGNWHVTGDTVKTYNGQLIDGQHRMAAVVLADKPIRTAFASGFTSESLHIDKGKPRTLPQWLQNDGHKSATAVASTVLLVLQYDLGQWKNKRLQLDEYTDEMVIEYAREYRESLENSIKLGRRCRGIVATSIASTFIHIASERICHPEYNDLITWFWGGIATGANLQEGDPPLALRVRLEADKRSKKSVIDPYFERMLVNIAWNRAAEGKQMSRTGLRIRLVGPTRQTLPEKILDAPWIQPGEFEE